MKNETFMVAISVAVIFGFGGIVGSSFASKGQTPPHMTSVYAINKHEIYLCSRVCRDWNGLDSVTIGGGCVCVDGQQHFMEELP